MLTPFFSNTSNATMFGILSSFTVPTDETLSLLVVPAVEASSSLTLKLIRKLNNFTYKNFIMQMTL